MQLATKEASNEPLRARPHGFHFVIEPEPWLRVFRRNVADLFRPDPAPVWVTASPAPYWADAQVHRPVAWSAIRQSFLGHVLVVLSVYALTLAWLNQPRVLPNEPVRTAVLHYQLSEYLPAVNPGHAKPIPPRRRQAQKADPEYSRQEILSINPDHISTRQTIVQPNPVILRQDVPLPNLVASTSIPGAPVAMNHPLQILPVNVPQIVPPAQQAAERNMSRLQFPLPQPPEVAAPASAVAVNHLAAAVPMSAPVVIPPSQDAAARKPDSLQIPAQMPPEVAAPSSEIAVRHALSQAMPMSAPQVAPPGPAPIQRNLSSLGLPAQQQPAERARPRRRRSDNCLR